MGNDWKDLLEGLSRRGFLGAAALGAGTLLAHPEEHEDKTKRRRRGRHHHRDERRHLFINLSHEAYVGREYHLLLGKQRYRLRELRSGDDLCNRERRQNRFLSQIPDSQITHVVENAIIPGGQVTLGYTIAAPNTTTGEWQMSSISLLLPSASLSYAYSRALDIAGEGAPLPISAKRRKYGLAAATSLRDLVEEQSLVDTTDWATAMVNVHPEMLSADPDSAAHIQVNYINPQSATFTLSEALGIAGPAQPQSATNTDNASGWATLVPYTDSDGNPLVNTTGKNAGLILYDPKWQPNTIVPFVRAAMTPALQGVKNDTTLGADVTNGSQGVSNGCIWTRSDGVTSLTSAPGVQASSGNSNYTLTNVTPFFSGYSCNATTSINGDNAEVTLNFKNWYVRYLGLYIQFLKSDNSVVPVSSLPPGLFPGNVYATANNELLMGSLTPEFTLYGIPVQASSNSVTFAFPSNLASSAKILASGLGTGSHTAADTEVLGIIMTSLFNLAIPVTLLALTIGTDIDIFVQKLAFPFALLVAKEIATVVPDGNSSQVITIFWRAIVKGAVGPALGQFATAFTKFLIGEEVQDGLEDAIPIVGEILQAIGVIGTLAEIAETTAEVLSSPWTYEYDLVATYDLTLAISPDQTPPGEFPAAAASYTVSAIFDNGTPHAQTVLFTNTGAPKLSVTLPQVPLGGNVTLTVGFYTVDNIMVGHGTTGSIQNVPSTSPAIAITNVRLPITSSTVYQHYQKTSLDAQGNHLWLCAPAPAAPANPIACDPAPGNLCAYRSITYSPALGNVGYAWRSYANSSCAATGTGGAGQVDQLASLLNQNSGENAQQQYASLPCGGISGSMKLVYDPLGRVSNNYFIDANNLVRQVVLGSATVFPDPTKINQAWGAFTLPPDDVLLHPSGQIITINATASRMESLRIPSSYSQDTAARFANLYGGLGSRPGLFNAPTVATITSDGVVLILEAGNNRIHAVDACGNPVRHFTSQPTPYFLNLTATGGNETQYLDIAVEFSGFIYVLSVTNAIYRLDIYAPDATNTSPLSTTMGFNAAKLTVDYWRTVYSLNYEVLMINGAVPPSGVTEPSVSQWLPVAPPPCNLRTPPQLLSDLIASS